jgi:hypothetical protein
MTIPTLKLATTEQADMVWAVAGDWLATTHGFFSGGGMVPKIAVAEFLANQEGLTLYASRGEPQL